MPMQALPQIHIHHFTSPLPVATMWMHARMDSVKNAVHPALPAPTTATSASLVSSKWITIAHGSDNVSGTTTTVISYYS